MAMQTAPGGKVDRQTTTPFHLKLFYRTGSFHRLDEFPSNTASTPLPSHLQIYTWPSCTLRELSHLLTSALPSLLPSPVIGTRLAYKLIYPDTRDTRPGPGRYLSKELGNVLVGGDGPGILSTEEEKTVVQGGVMAGELGGEPDKTLQDARFVIGDFISCAIFEPLPNGDVAPVPRAGIGGDRVAARGRDYGSTRGGDYGPPRENGFGGYRGRSGPRGGGGFGGGRYAEGRLGEGVPSGEWRRGERIPDGGRGYAGYGRGRGRGY